MKKILLSGIVLTFCFSWNGMTAQTNAGKKISGPYTIRNSAVFESPKSHFVLDPIVLNDGNILQVNVDRAESFNFQLFSKDLKLVKENTMEVKSKFGERPDFWRIGQFKIKTYAFVREVYRETGSEGVSAIEIDPKTLNLVGSSKSLFKSSGKVKMNLMDAVGVATAGMAVFVYDMFASQDNSKFLCTYTLAPREKKDMLNKDIIGLQVFDENLGNLWGGEFEMPYTEAKMDNLGYTLTNDGKVCLLAKVYEGESKKDGAKDKTKPNYHFEVFVYQKNMKTPKQIEIKLDNYFNREAYIYESNKGVAIAGFYGKEKGAGVDGAYLVTLDVDKVTISKVNGGYYELPTDFIKSFMSERQKRKTEEKMEEGEDIDLELNNVRIRSIYATPDGSTKIVSQIFYVVTKRNSNGQTTYTYVYKDAIIMSIKGGKLDWVQKIPKIQVSHNGRGCSINTLAVSNDIHIFWKDHPDNSKRAKDEKLAKFNGINGILKGCVINSKGEMKNYDIVDVGPYDMHFDIKSFVEGGANNLISTERRKKENMLFSIDVNPVK